MYTEDSHARVAGVLAGSGLCFLVWTAGDHWKLGATDVVGDFVILYLVMGLLERGSELVASDACS